MDIFQLVGDFLHLIAVLMLLLKILANKNVIGIMWYIFRSIISNSITFPCGFFGSIYRSISRMEDSLRIRHEDCVYQFDSVYNLPDEN